MSVKKISEAILGVGVDDTTIDLFESQYPVPTGVSYNSYVIRDEKTAVLDTVDARATDPWLENLAEALNGTQPDYLIVSHMEPDHGANIAKLAARYPAMQVVGNAKTFQYMEQFFGADAVAKERRVVVKDGESLSLGSHTLTFVFAPMVHWPEVMVSYESTEKVLFSADGFGRFGAVAKFDEHADWASEARRYFLNIVGKYGPQVQALLKKAAALDIQTICPLHGPVLTGDLSNGQLRVRVAKTERVTLIFRNFTASSSTSAPIYLVSADKCVIELADGSVNRLADAKTYVFSDPTETKPNACLYAGCDLKIKGKGSLIVEGNYNNGIGCKNDLEISNGQITVSAPNNILKGNNSVTVTGGKLVLSGGEDAIKSDEEIKEGKGYILISEDAVIDITCSDDALQAPKSVTVEATARLTVSCGNLVNCPGVYNIADGAVTMK